MTVQLFFAIIINVRKNKTLRSRLNISASGVTAKNKVKSTRTLKVYEAYPRFKCQDCGEEINVVATVNRTKGATIFCTNCASHKRHERIPQVAVQLYK